MQRLVVGLVVGLAFIAHQSPGTASANDNVQHPHSVLQGCRPSLVRSHMPFQHAAYRRSPVTHPVGVVALVRALPGRPYGVAVARNGITYLALIGSHVLLRGDLASRNFTEPVSVGDTPPHVVLNPAGTRAYATLQNGQAVVMVDAANNTLMATLPLSSDGFNLAVSPSGERVYVTTAGGDLYVLDATSYTIIATLNVGRAANGLAFSPDGCTVYVSSRDAATVTAISTSSNTITRTYALSGMPQRVAVAPDGLWMYVANEHSGLDIVNLETGVASSVSFGTAGYGVGLTPDGEQLYVSLPAAGQVRILDRATLAPVNTVFVGGVPRNITFDWSGRTALVTTEEAVVFIE
jgi:YVTN family beta-propeller protein